MLLQKLDTVKMQFRHRKSLHPVGPAGETGWNVNLEHLKHFNGEIKE